MKAKSITGYMIKTHRNVLIARTFGLTEEESISKHALPDHWWTIAVEKGYRCVPVIIEEREIETI